MQGVNDSTRVFLVNTALSLEGSVMQRLRAFVALPGVSGCAKDSEQERREVKLPNEKEACGLDTVKRGPYPAWIWPLEILLEVQGYG